MKIIASQSYCNVKLKMQTHINFLHGEIFETIIYSYNFQSHAVQTA